MAITEDDKKFITSRLVFALAGFFIAILASALIGTYVMSRVLVTEQARAPGPMYGFAAGLDTPVVLVGGSLAFRSDAQSNAPAWIPTPGGNGNDYYIDPGYSVSVIVVKQTAPPDPDNGDPPNKDADPGSDKISVGIPSSNAGTWQVDEYTAASGDTAVASIKPGPGTQIHLTIPSGFLCSKGSGKKLKYGQASGCADAQTFSQVTISLDGNRVGNLACNDGSGTPGKCRIVLKGLH